MNEVDRKQQNIDNALGNKGYTTAELELLQFGNVDQARNIAAFGESKNRDLYLGFVWAKLPGKQYWTRYYARVQNSSIYFCKSVESNDFQVCYVIYNASIEMMKLQITEWDGNMHECMIIKHDFDTNWLLLGLQRKKSKQSFMSVNDPE